jgi:transposase
METLNLHNQKVFVGIDVHKKSWSVSIFFCGIHHKTFSQAPHPETLKVYLDRYFPAGHIICAYETTRFGFWIARTLQSYGYECLVVNAADIPTSQKESHNKTDPVDSRKIARSLQAGLLTSVHIPALDCEADRQLVRYRKKVWADLVRTKNRIKSLLALAGVEIPPEWDNPTWSKAFLQWLRTLAFPQASMRRSLDLLLEQFDLLEKHLRKAGVEARLLLRQARYKQTAKLLRTIPGIGPLTTLLILTEIGNWNRFSSFKKLNSFVGFKPGSHNSGEQQYMGKITCRKHNQLRSALVESAWVAVGADPVMAVKYQELTKRMTGKRAIVVIARKLLSRIAFVLREQQPYQVGIVQ